MLRPSRLAPFAVLVYLAASIFADFVMAAAETEAESGVLNDWSESFKSTKLSPLSHSSSQSFLTAPAENIGAAAARVGKENDHTGYERRAFADEASSSAAIPQRPAVSSNLLSPSPAEIDSTNIERVEPPGRKFSFPWVPGQTIRKKPKGMKKFGKFTSFMEDVLVQAAKTGSEACKGAVGTLNYKTLGQIKSVGHYPRLALMFLACGIAPRDFVHITKADLEFAKGDDFTVKRAKTSMAKNLIDKAFEEYIEQLIQPENLQKLYKTELQLRGKYVMVEVTSLKEFEEKTRMKLHTKDRHKIYCDVLQVISPVCEGWKAMDSKAYDRFSQHLKDGTFTGNLADYFSRSEVSRYCERWLAMRKESEEKAKETKQAGKKAMVEAESTESSFSLEAPGTSREKKTKEAIAFRSGKRTLRHSEQGREEEERGSRGTIQEKYRPNG